MNLYTQYLETEVGRLRLVASDKGLRGVYFPDHKRDPGVVGAEASNPFLTLAALELNEYFAGSRKEFSVPLDENGTVFQLRVWKLLRDIPFGQTWSYGQLAEKLGDKNAVRAVAGANARNPISIITPCHRVIASNGKLTGYAGGVEIKEILLNLEHGDSDRPAQSLFAP